MRNFLLVVIICLLNKLALGQLRIQPGIQWVNSGAVTIVLQDMNFVNDGTMTPGSSKIKFTGNAISTAGGTGTGNFHELVIAKTGNSLVALSNNITVNNFVQFSSGLLDLNQRNLVLAEPAYLLNETETSRVTGSGGGEVILTLPMNAPAAYNPGNLGAVISSASNLGSVVVRRGHKAQAGTGMTGSIRRYFDISPTNNIALGASFRVNYFNAELNSQAENSLEMYRSVDAGLNWTNQSFSGRDANLNFVEQTGINSFSRWTLSGNEPASPDYTLVQSFPSLGFPFAGFSRDFIVGAVNINNMASIDNPASPLEFRIIKQQAFTMTAMDNVMVTNGTPVNNSDWIIDNSHQFYMKFILKNSASIASNGQSLIGITITRNNIVGANTTGNITSVIVIGSGGDSGNQNNTVSTQIVAQ